MVPIAVIYKFQRNINPLLMGLLSTLEKNYRTKDWMYNDPHCIARKKL